MNTRECQEYAERVANNVADTIRQVTESPNGMSRTLSPEVAAGVMVVQSNLSIAAALMWLAAELKDHR